VPAHASITAACSGAQTYLNMTSRVKSESEAKSVPELVESKTESESESVVQPSRAQLECKANANANSK